jgi:superfamily I DNA/RNA helicase
MNSAQRQVADAPPDAKIFLSGPVGCGKTTAGVERLRQLMVGSQSAGSVLVLTPQRTLQAPYEALLRSPEIGPGRQATLATIGGLARRMLELFWPLVAETAGFSHPNLPPVFLTLETAQYFMARILRPLLEEGFFASVTMDHNRLYSQVLDNLNKAASIGFNYSEIGDRLSSAWFGDQSQRRVYADVQESASRFRRYCLEHNLLDFSLQLELFSQVLWRTPECRSYLTGQFNHLVYDNV